MSVMTALIFAAPASASGTLYDCAVKQTSGPRGWISSRIGIVIDDTGAAQIIDSLTLQFETGPRPARLRRKDDTLRLNWSFEALNDKANTIIPKFSFSGTLDTKTGAFKVRGKPARFPQNVRGQGTCTSRGNLSTKQLNRLLRG
jgi:hypothetical protein